MIPPWFRSEANTDRTFSNPVELPSMDAIEKMEQQREEAIAALEIVGDNVRCQKCNGLYPLGPKLTSYNHSGEIKALRSKINHAERYYHGIGDISNNNTTIQQLKEELAQLIKQEEKNDLLRRIPLYSSRITKFRFVCSACFDKTYQRKRNGRHIQKLN